MHKNKARSGRQATDGDYRGPQQALPGSSTSFTGVPNKLYRGPQQALPGSLARTTGVPNKLYRGPQQVVEKFVLQSHRFFAPAIISLYCYVLYVVNNNRNREGRG